MAISEIEEYKILLMRMTELEKKMDEVLKVLREILPPEKRKTTFYIKKLW